MLVQNYVMQNTCMLSKTDFFTSPPPLDYNMCFYIIKIKDESLNSRMAFK